MNWSDERYVRLYTRDTPEWVALPWQAKALWPLLLRRMDRAGVIEVRPGARRVSMLAGLVQLPLELVEVGLAALLDDGCLVATTEGLVSPNYLAAQESRASDAKRQRDHRERRRSGMLEGTPSQNVTKRHDLSHGVTPSRAVPCLAVPSRTDEEALSLAPVVATIKPARKPRLPSAGALEAAEVQGVWNEHRGSLPEWKLTAPKRAATARTLLHAHGLERIAEAVQRLAASPFCTGTNDRGWTAGPDFLLRPGKLEEVLEGKYDARRGNSIASNVGSKADFDADPYFTPTSGRT